MAELNYDDFLNRVNIQDVLRDAGYQLNRRDGLRYPSYVRLDTDGRRIKGDKFIVTGNGKCCFQPPMQKNYNVIGFIKEFPHLFKEYNGGMDKDRLVNLVCNRLLNNPIENRSYINLQRERELKPFSLNNYKVIPFKADDFESQKPFYPYFKSRGISLSTQRTFGNDFFIAERNASNGKSYSNLSFPLKKPQDLEKIVGLEERSKANAKGKTLYKGMAEGSNATEGLWIASPNATPLNKAKDVLWFESAYDAMAYYQLNKKDNSKMLDNAVFVSTGGNPSKHQFEGMLKQTPEANHHLCFDRDRAGRIFAFNFLIAKDNSNYRTSQPTKGVMMIDDKGEKFYTDITREDFSLKETIRSLDLNLLMKPNDLSDYMKTLRNEDDIMTGDYDLLKGDTGKAFGHYQALAEEYHEVGGQFSIPICKEELADMKNALHGAFNDFKSSLDKAFKEYESCPKVIYEPCKEEYKDWNDQLLDKKSYLQNSEMTIDGDNAVNEEVENFEDKNENEETEKKNSHFHR